MYQYVQSDSDRANRNIKKSRCLCSWHLVAICQVTTNDTASGMGHGVASLSLKGVGQGYMSCYRRVFRVCVHVPRAQGLVFCQKCASAHVYMVSNQYVIGV